MLVFEWVMLNGREGPKSSADMVPSSSASQSEIVIDARGEISGEGVNKCNDGGVCFRRIMARFHVRILEPVQSLLPALLQAWERARTEI